MLPRSNLEHLVLREDVARAIAEGKFHLYAVATVAQGIEVLTGVPAGERDAVGPLPGRERVRPRRASRHRDRRAPARGRGAPRGAPGARLDGRRQPRGSGRCRGLPSPLTARPARRLGRARGALESIGQLLRPELAELVAYVPHDPPGIEVRLDANEAPPCSPPCARSSTRAIAGVALERYPDPRALRLKEAIARRTGAKVADLLVGTGSDEVIALVANALAWPRRRNTQGVILTPTPTFVMYRITARAHGLKPVEVPLDATWDLDVAMTKKAIAMMQPSVVFVASPNNPTGNRMSLGSARGDREGRGRGGGGIGHGHGHGHGHGRERDGQGGDGGHAAQRDRDRGRGRGAFTIVDEAYVDYSGPGASRARMARAISRTSGSCAR